MGRGVILVRHAMPQVIVGTASTLWRLSEPAREDCVLLAHALPKDVAPVIYTSPESKAAETASVVALRLGLTVTADARLSEADRPQDWEDDYRATVLRYLAAGHEAGWEPAATVRRRFAAAVDDALTMHTAGDIVVSNHGMALSLYCAGVAGIEAAGFWQNLTFPDAWRLDRESRTLHRLYFGGLPPE